MKSKPATAVAALSAFALSAWFGPPAATQEAAPRKQSLAIPLSAIPLSVAASPGKPAPSIQCTLAYGPHRYLATSNADAIHWTTANVTMPPEKITTLSENAELLPKAIAGEKVATPVVE
jgi:hypothetical protein